MAQREISLWLASSSVIVSQLRAKIRNIHELVSIKVAEKLSGTFVPTRRSDYVRLSTCAFSLWKEHCKTWAQTRNSQRVKLNENVNESIASDMKNSNPIITRAGVGIFITTSHHHDTFKEIRGTSAPSTHDPSSVKISTRTRSRKSSLKKNNPGPSSRSLITSVLTRHRTDIHVPEQINKKEKDTRSEVGYTEKRAENSSTRDGMTRRTDGSRELKNKKEKKNMGGTQSFPCSNVSRRGEHHVTLTDSSANDAAAYLNARKKEGIIKKGETREYVYVIYTSACVYICLYIYVRCSVGLS